HARRSLRSQQWRTLEHTRSGAQCTELWAIPRTRETDVAGSMSRLIDVVIAVHDKRRPIARAVGSVLDSGLDDDTMRVTVVCHNLDRGEIAGVLGPELAGRVRLLELMDGIHSPAGPFNHGIGAADARFISIMGSD